MSAFLVPREGIRLEEGCFEAFVGDVSIGFVQVFKDNTAGYWRRGGEQAKPAASKEAALKALEDMHRTTKEK